MAVAVFLVLAFLPLCHGTVIAQDTVWARQFGTAGPDHVNSVAVDSRGNVFVAGQTSGTLPGQSWGGGFTDAYLKMYDSAGEEVWLRQFGGSGDDAANAVAASPSGDVYVAGRTGGESTGAMMLGGVSGTFLRKYNAEGTELWASQFGFENFAGSTAVDVDTEGSVYVAGSVQGALPGQVALGPEDAFLRKYGSDGEELWTAQMGGVGADFALDVAVNSAGEAYVVGWSRNIHPDQGNAVSMNAFVNAFDKDGATLWSTRLDLVGFSQATAVDVDGEGNLYVSGWVSGVLAGQTQVGATDAFLGKYAPTGELIWARQFGTPDEDRALDVAASPGGTAYLVGWSRGVFPRQDDVPERSVLVRRDGFVRAYDGMGEQLWTRQFGTLKDQSANSLALDNSGNILLTGETAGPLFDQGSVGGTDVFLVKMSGGPSDTLPVVPPPESDAAGEAAADKVPPTPASAAVDVLDDPKGEQPDSSCGFNNSRGRADAGWGLLALGLLGLATGRRVMS